MIGCKKKLCHYTLESKDQEKTITTRERRNNERESEKKSLKNTNLIG